MKRLYYYFTPFERILWSTTMLFIIAAFLVFDRVNYLTLIASVIGGTSLIFSAKGNPFGEFLMVIFSVFYGIISYSYHYYGEMITYLGMTGPMSLFALISWLGHPFENKKSEVKINKLSKKEMLFSLLLTAAVTTVFYFILVYFNTANIIFSTISVATSFLAVYLTFRRSPYFAIVYALNDVVLIVLWIMAAIDDVTYISVVICFIAFLVNDIYGFVKWKKMYKRQLND